MNIKYLSHSKSRRREEPAVRKNVPEKQLSDDCSERAAAAEIKPRGKRTVPKREASSAMI